MTISVSRRLNILCNMFKISGLCNITVHSATYEG